MSITIYERRNYKIYKIYKNKDTRYIVHNTDRDFDIGHTHVNNYNLAKIIISCCIAGELPNSKKLQNNYKVLESITRVCNSKHKNKFIIKLKEIQNKKTLP